MRLFVRMMSVLLGLAAAISLHAQAPEVPDASVITDKGDTVRFLSDLVGKKTAVIDFIYTTCGGICPMQGQVYDRLSRALGPRLGRDVILISITIDPDNDTPSKLASWKSRFSGNSGWTCVTGEAATVRELTRTLLGKPVQGLGHDATAVIFYPATRSRRVMSSLAGPGPFIAAIDAGR